MKTGSFTWVVSEQRAELPLKASYFICPMLYQWFLSEVYLRGLFRTIHLGCIFPPKRMYFRCRCTPKRCTPFGKKMYILQISVGVATRPISTFAAAYASWRCLPRGSSRCFSLCRVLWQSPAMKTLLFVTRRTFVLAARAGQCQ